MAMQQGWCRGVSWWVLSGLCAVLGACGGGGGGDAAAPPATVASAVSGAAVTALPANPTPKQPVVSLFSDAGDYIGAGRTLAYDHAGAHITLRVNGATLNIEVEGDERWSGSFALPAPATAWAPGTYTGLVRHPFQPAGAGALSWTGEGNGCNTLTGTLEVRSVRYDNGVLAAIDLGFEQHCEGVAPALRGNVNWDALTPVPTPAPANPPPTNLWTPPASVTATRGNAMYVESIAGDYIGQGWTYWLGAATAAAGGGSGGDTSNGTATVNTTATGGLLLVTVGGAVNWRGEFRAPAAMGRLQPGYYGVLKRYPFNNPVRGGLSWTMDGRACNRLLGWFAIDQVVYSGDQLQSVDLRFEQFCDGSSTPLRGWLRWTPGNTSG